MLMKIQKLSLNFCWSIMFIIRVIEMIFFAEKWPVSCGGCSNAEASSSCIEPSEDKGIHPYETNGQVS